MDELGHAVDVLRTFEEITNVNISNNEIKYITFVLEKHDFLMLCPSVDMPSSKVSIFAMNDQNFDYPHIMTEGFDVLPEKNLPEGNYRSLCLYEEGDMVMSLFSYEEKIIDSIERLLELLHLSKTEKEKELQREFLYYWDEYAKDAEISLFIGDSNTYKKLNVYTGKSDFRCVALGVSLNDKEKKEGGEKCWRHQTDIASYYIPIIDNRGILPPIKGKEWSTDDILNIIYGRQINHISHEAFEFISKEQIKGSRLILSFGMVIEGARKIFSIFVYFKNATRDSIINKIKNDVASFQIVKSNRLDYSGLCEAIGNRTDLISKRVLIVGAGSLGSYVASELVKNGINTLTIYDGDKLEPENTMRWVYGGFGQGMTKPISLKLFLEFLHPEIHINAYGVDLDEEKLKKEILTHDLVIFTIGSSDKQLFFNNLLKRIGCSVPVIYTWIEAGGNYSHILKVHYTKRGCFQCLYTNSSGEMQNNKANSMDVDTQGNLILRNGCGGTRAPYGTAVLLRTTSVLLHFIDELFQSDSIENYLVNISEREGYRRVFDFDERMCECCGNRTAY